MSAVATATRAPGCHQPDAATYRRRRLAAAALLATLVMGAWLACRAVVDSSSTFAGPGPAVVAGTPVAARSWVVGPGDTLWGIALAAGARGDIRPYVDMLAAETGNRPLVVGEVVPLPPVR